MPWLAPDPWENWRSFEFDLSRRVVNRPSPFLYALALVISFSAALILTPLARRFAFRVGLHDEPSSRKAHPEPIALLGGVAIYGAAALAAFLVAPGVSEELKGVFLGGLVILFVGLQDDLAGMDVWVKLVGQATAGLVLAGFGFRAHLLGIPAFDTALTVAWIVVVVNAINLSDNMDGLAGGLAAVASISYFAIAVSWNQYLVAVIAALLTGGVAGFLVYNFPPAKIFMGDAGSHILGYLLAVMGMSLRFPVRPKLVALFVPVIVVAVPLLDMSMVAISRWRRGIPASTGGTDHTSHRLVVRGMTRRQAILTLWLVGLTCGLVAFLVSHLPSPFAFGLVGLFTIASLFFAIWLERLGAPEALVFDRAETADEDVSDASE